MPAMPAMPKNATEHWPPLAALRQNWNQQQAEPQVVQEFHFR